MHELGEGELELYKARIVACGNDQKLGVNFLLPFDAVLEWRVQRLL